MTISLMPHKKQTYGRVDADVLSIWMRPYTPFYDLRIVWPDGERDTIMMAVEGLNRWCPDWRKFRREQAR